MRPLYLKYLALAVALLTTSAALAQDPPQRWPDAQPSQGGGEAAPRTAVPRNEPPPPREAPPPPPAAAPAPRPAAPAAAPRATAPERSTADDDGQRTAQPRRREPPREDPQQTGVAVPRGSVPAPPATTSVPSSRVYNNYYYYPRRYYPYGYGAFGLGYFYYDPYTWYPYGSYQNYRFTGYGYGYPTGELRLRVRPRHAEVYVDGYYAGTVDDFDGIVQALRLESGPYSIEVVAPGYAPLEFDVYIQPDRKITYRGELRPLRP